MAVSAYPRISRGATPINAKCGIVPHFARRTPWEAAEIQLRLTFHTNSQAGLGPFGRTQLASAAIAFFLAFTILRNREPRSASSSWNSKRSDQARRHPHRWSMVDHAARYHPLGSGARQSRSHGAARMSTVALTPLSPRPVTSLRIDSAPPRAERPMPPSSRGTRLHPKRPSRPRILSG